MRRPQSCLFAVVLASTAFAIRAAPPLGDTQGLVEAVIVDHNYQLGYNRFTVYFSSVENDRFGCLVNGAITVRDDALGVSPESFRQMFAVALAAQATGRRMGLSQAGSNSCINVNGAWMLN